MARARRAGRAIGLPSLIVLLIVINWFFHKVYGIGWISHHHKHRRGLLASDPDTSRLLLLLLLWLRCSASRRSTTRGSRS